MLIGEINVPESIINLELRIGVLERAFDYILANNYSLTKPSQADIEKFKKDTTTALQQRYPNSGIQVK